MLRQREPEGNGNHQLHQPPFSSPCFLGNLKSALVVPPYGVLLSSILDVPTRRMAQAHKPKATLATGECGPSRLMNTAGEPRLGTKAAPKGC